MSDATMYDLAKERSARKHRSHVVPLQMVLVGWQMALTIQAFWLSAMWRSK